MKTTTTTTVASRREWISDKSLTRPLNQEDYGSTVWKNTQKLEIILVSERKLKTTTTKNNNNKTNNNNVQTYHIKHLSQRCLVLSKEVAFFYRIDRISHKLVDLIFILWVSSQNIIRSELLNIFLL